MEPSIFVTVEENFTEILIMIFSNNFPMVVALLITPSTILTFVEVVFIGV